MHDGTRTLDPRVARTQRLLHDALIELTLERGWNELSVQQVCARAGVGRSTFYVHFADTEELLLSNFRREHVVPHATGTFGFLRPLIQHIDAHNALYLALLGTRCERAVRRRFMDIVAELVEADLARVMQPSAQRTAAVRYVAGACNETLTSWLSQRARSTPSELEHWLRQFSTGVVNQLR
jgi:AcrR family transcriptional regulator